tara:strand:+ start:1210 stop:3231 length:2022 start_codon:yes stop_codon:yes gene_type:complete
MGNMNFDRTLWVDLLSFKTFLIVCLRKNKNFDCIRYINVHKTFAPFLDFSSKVLRKPIFHLDNVVLSDEYISNSNLPEIIQSRVHELIDQWIESPYTKKRIINFIKHTEYSESKYIEYLKNRAFFLAYKPVEIYSISEAISKSHTNLFLLKKTPLNQEIKSIIGHGLVDFYSYSGYAVEKRKKSAFDSKINKIYYRSNLFSAVKLLVNWIFISFSSLFSVRNNNEAYVSNIGVELIQKKVKLDFISDSYWLKNSDIDLNTVIGLTSIDYDSKSWANIDKIGIKVFNISGSIFKSLLHSVRYRNMRAKPKFVYADKKYFINTISRTARIFPSIFLNNSYSWFSLQEGYYSIRTEFWKSILSQFNIKMLWSMYDVDEDKLVKAQALELCKGLYLGSHWSNYPMRPRVDETKCYDIFFVWSKYFISNSFSPSFAYKAFFQLGYPSDYYFDSAKKDSEVLKNNYSDSFVISYFDNQFHNDGIYSENLNFDICNLLIELLTSYNNIVVFFKPKRKSTFNDYLSRFPVLREFINIGRAVVFYGDSERSKARPAEVALASDLVLGVGISSAAAEGCFAGSVSFHANLSKVNNDFDKKTLNKVVFRDLNSLKIAIINQINGKGISVEECQDFHRILDPFQDGLAYKRTGSILSKIQIELNNGKDTNKVIKKIKDNFLELSC